MIAAESGINQGLIEQFELQHKKHTQKQPTPCSGDNCWEKAKATNYGNYNSLKWTDVACSDCTGCEAKELVGKNPCITAKDNAPWGSATCKKAGCYAIKCVGSWPEGGVDCKNKKNPIIVRVIDDCGDCTSSVTKKDSIPHIFDINNQAYYEIADGSGPIEIEYKEVSCDKMPSNNLNNSCIIKE